MMAEKFITLAHGGGGRAQNDFLKEEILSRFRAPELAELPDGAVLPDGLVVSTDSFVVTPRFFPGGNIGKLAVTGTVNDIYMAGGVPRCLTLGMILEEGLPFAELRAILDSIRDTARAAKVAIVTGDTKVVPRGAGDGVYLNTTGIGRRNPALKLSRSRFAPGDRIVVSGGMGEHGMTILALRHKLDAPDLKSDCQSLADAVQEVCKTAPAGVKFMRDATRGGVLGVTAEIMEGSGLGAVIDESALPVRKEVAALARMLGIDPGFAACEGRMVAVVAPDAADDCVKALRALPGGELAAVIGEVTAQAGRVTLRNAWGLERPLLVPAGDQLPRIC